MKVLMVNSVCGIRSTGRICTDIATELEAQGHEVKIAYGRESVPTKYQKYSVRIGSNIGIKINAFKARILDNEGLNAVWATRKFLKWADNYNPDLLWLHNIHGYYLNYKLLFDWIKTRPNMIVKWTLHDCWAFTGHCAYFTMCGCEKWKDGCCDCMQSMEYPSSLFVSKAERNYFMKMECFSSVNKMELITPSKWLANLTRESFLKEYPVEVVYNTIDLSIFKKVDTNIKEKLGIKEKIILGVAAIWDKRKGLDDFLKLANDLKNVKIILVGLTDKQISTLPPNVIGVKKTNSPQELAEFYSASDVFFLPTKEDNYPTVCLEAEACGTAVVTYDVGGCKETLRLNNSIAVSGYEEAKQKIVNILNC